MKSTATLVAVFWCLWQGCQAAMSPAPALSMRYNLQGKQISSDLGDYDIFHCEGAESNRTCSLVSYKSSTTDYNSFAQTQGNYLEYIQGVGMYATINFIGVVFLLVGLKVYIFICIIRFIICCPCLKSDKVHPDGVTSKKTKKSLCKNKNIFYAGYVFVVMMMISILLILSDQLGNKALTTSTVKLSGIANGMRNVVRDSYPAFVDMIIQSSDQIIAPSMDSTGKLVDKVVDMDTLVDALTVINTTLFNFIPVSELSAQVDLISTQTTSVSSLLDDSFNDILPCVDQENKLLESAHNLTFELNRLDRAVNFFIVPSLNALQDDIDAVNGNLTSLTMAGSNFVDVKTECSSFRTVSEGGDVPDQSDILDAITDLESLASGSFDNSAQDISDLLDKLGVLRTHFNALPDLDGVGVDLLQLNNTVQQLLEPSGKLALLESNVAYAEAVLSNCSNLYDAQSIEDYLITFNATFNGETLKDFSAVTEKLIAFLPPFSGNISLLGDMLNNELDIIDVVDQLFIVNGLVARVNASLIELPNEVNQIVDLFDKVNETISSSVGELLGYVNLVYDASDDINTLYVNSTLFHNELDDVIDDIDHQSNNVATPQLHDFIVTMQGSCSSVDLSPLISHVSMMRSILVNITVTSSQLVDLSALQTNIESIQTKLDELANPTTGEYYYLSGGYCNTINSQLCFSNQDCSNSGSGTTCMQMGGYRCKNSPSTACTEDSDCPGDICLASSSDATSLKDLLFPYKSSVSPADTVTNIYHNLEYAYDAIDDFVNAGYDTDISDDATQFSALDTTVYMRRLKDIIDTINSYDIGLLSDILSTANDAINVIDYDMITDLMDDIGSKVDGVLNKQKENIAKYLTSVIAVRDFLKNDDGLSAIVKSLQSEHLSCVLNDHGPSAVVFEIISTIDNVTQYFSIHQDGFKVKASHFAKDNKKQSRFLDRWGAADHTPFAENDDHGSLYYLLSLSALTSNKILEYDDPQASGVVADDSGKRYEDGRYCVTEKCLSKTINAVNTLPMDEISADEFPGTASLPVPVSRENLFLGLWFPPFVVILLGLWGVLCQFCVSCPCKNLPSCAMASCILCQLPWIFILTAFLLPFFVVLSDVCDSGANIGVQYITEYGNGLCSHKFQSNGTIENCVYSRSLPDDYGGSVFSVEYDPVNLFRGLVGGDCRDPDPVVAVFDSIAESLRTIPLDAVNKIIPEDGSEGTIELPYSLRSDLTAIPRNASIAAGEIMYDFFRNEARDAFTCQNTHDAILALTDGFCVDILPPLFFYVYLWYLLAWTMCCCALPAAWLSCHANLESGVLKEPTTTTTSRKNNNTALTRPMLLRNKVFASGPSGGIGVVPSGIAVGVEVDKNVVGAEVEKTSDTMTISNRQLAKLESKNDPHDLEIGMDSSMLPKNEIPIAEDIKAGEIVQASDMSVSSLHSA